MRPSPRWILTALVVCASFKSHAQDVRVILFDTKNRPGEIRLLAVEVEALARQQSADIWIFPRIRPDWSDELANAVAVGARMEVDFYPPQPGRDNRWLMVYDRLEVELSDLARGAGPVVTALRLNTERRPQDR